MLNDLYLAAEKVFLHDWRRRQVQVIHNDRRFLATLKFTRVQLHKYDSVVVGVNERLDRLLASRAR